MEQSKNNENLLSVFGSGPPPPPPPAKIKSSLLKPLYIYMYIPD